MIIIKINQELLEEQLKRTKDDTHTLDLSLRKKWCSIKISKQRINILTSKHINVSICYTSIYSRSNDQEYILTFNMSNGKEWAETLTDIKDINKIIKESVKNKCKKYGISNFYTTFTHINTEGLVDSIHLERKITSLQDTELRDFIFNSFGVLLPM